MHHLTYLRLFQGKNCIHNVGKKKRLLSDVNSVYQCMLLTSKPLYKGKMWFGSYYYYYYLLRASRCLCNEWW